MHLTLLLFFCKTPAPQMLFGPVSTRVAHVRTLKGDGFLRSLVLSRGDRARE